MNKPVIAVTMGDPAGVGPELCLRVLHSLDVVRQTVPVVFGDAAFLRHLAALMNLPYPGRVVSLEAWQAGKGATLPTLVDCRALDPGAEIRAGEVRAECGRAAYTCVAAAVAEVMAGRVQAVATAPLHKEALRLAGVDHPGHTEILAALTGARRVCMMLASDHLVVSLVTIHMRLAEVPGAVTRERILDAIELTADALVRIGKTSPRIAVCGLNPHAGEGGLFGDEERLLIAPAIEAARELGLAVEGPLPPDTAFIPSRRGVTDAYVAMYHDQGLIPFKMMAFDKGVNITLGLPFVRTSVDHGTAFDIAWKGKASAESLTQSILWAARLIPRTG